MEEITGTRGRGGRQKILLVILFLIGALPVLGPSLLIYQYGVDVPYWDQWNVVEASLQARQGGIPSSLFAQHNEHRIVVPRLIYCVLDNLTHWNQFGSMLASLIIVCITSLGIYFLSRSTIPDEPDREVKAIGIWFVCNLLIFTPAQYENWLWGIGLINFLPMAFIVWAMIVVRSSMHLWLKMAISLVLATAATFSVGDGVLAWPLIGILWLWSPSPAALKGKVGLLLIWCAGFAINMAMYFHHYRKPEHSLVAYSVDGRSIVVYILAFLGGPFGFGTLIPPVTQSMIIGLLLLALLAFGGLVFFWIWWVDGDSKFSFNMLVWLAVAGFAVGSGVLAGPTRAGFGAGQAIVSRYSTYALYLSVGLLNLSLMISGQRRFRQTKLWSHLGTSLITTIIIMQFLAVWPSIIGARKTYGDRQRVKEALLLLRSLPDDDPNLSLIFPIPSQLRQIAESLNQIGFIHPPLVATNHARDIKTLAHPKLAPGSYGYLDQVTQNDAHQLLASGWAVFPDAGTPADAIFLTWDRFDNDPIIFAMGVMGTPRQDVADYLHKPSVVLCGWNASCTITRLPPGKDPLRIRAWAFNLKTGEAAPISNELTLQR